MATLSPHRSLSSAVGPLLVLFAAGAGCVDGRLPIALPPDARPHDGVAPGETPALAACPSWLGLSSIGQRRTYEITPVPSVDLEEEPWLVDEVVHDVFETDDGTFVELEYTHDAGGPTSVDLWVCDAEGARLTRSLAIFGDEEELRFEHTGAWVPPVLEVGVAWRDRVTTWQGDALLTDVVWQREVVALEERDTPLGVTAVATVRTASTEGGAPGGTDEYADKAGLLTSLGATGYRRELVDVVP